MSITIEWEKDNMIQPNYINHILSESASQYQTDARNKGIQLLNLARLFYNSPQVTVPLLVDLIDGKRYVHAEEAEKVVAMTPTGTITEEYWIVSFPLTDEGVTDALQAEADRLQEEADAIDAALQTGVLLDGEE
jgi:hypothetical protein